MCPDLLIFTTGLSTSEASIEIVAPNFSNSVFAFLNNLSVVWDRFKPVTFSKYLGTSVFSTRPVSFSIPGGA